MYLEKVDNSKQLNQRPSVETNGSSAELKVQENRKVAVSSLLTVESLLPPLASMSGDRLVGDIWQCTYRTVNHSRPRPIKKNACKKKKSAHK